MRSGRAETAVRNNEAENRYLILTKFEILFGKH